MKTILVTGGAGFIGSELTEALLKEGYAVRVFDTFYFGKKHLIPLRGPLELIKGDIRKIDAHVLRGVEAIIHLAAISNDPMADFAPKLCYEINTAATKRLAEKAKKSGVPRFIFASSCSIYHQNGGNSLVSKEDAEVHPIAHYSVSKHEAEKILFNLSSKKFAVSILRMATVGGYSKRLKFDLAVNTMVKTSLTNREIIVFGGSQHRPLVDIYDVVKAYLTILKAPLRSIQTQVFNLAYDNYLVSTLATKIAKTLQSLGKETTIVQKKAEYEIKSYRVSTEKMKRLLNFQPIFSVEDTVKHLLKEIDQRKITDFNSPIYNNFLWTKDILAKLSSTL